MKKIINVLIVLQLFINIFSEYLYSVNQSLGYIFYMTDILNVIIFFIICVGSIYLKKLYNVRFTKRNIFAFIFVCFCLFSFLWGNASIFSAVLRLRYILGGLFFYFVCNNFLNDKTYTFVINSMFIVQYINLALCFYQNQIMGLHPDFCNGVFGYVGYANGIEGTFCLILSLIAVVYYLNKQWSLIKSLVLLAPSAIICAIAEIKIYFVIFFLCGILVILIQERNFKEQLRLAVMLGVVVLLFFFSYKIIEFILPNNLSTFFSIQKSLNYEHRTTYAGRTNTIPFIYENVFHDNFFHSLFGKGMGTLNKEFIYELGRTFSEEGFIGVSLLYLFLLINFLNSVFNRSTVSSEKLFVSTYSFGLMISIVVWNAFFTRTTYVVFFFLGIEYVKYLKRSYQNSENRRIGNNSSL